MELQVAKVSVMVREVKKILETYPNKKVIIFGNYNKVLESLCDELHEYGIVLLNGTVKSKFRDDVISLFQQDDLECRIIAANTIVGGVGIDLDDKTGNHPREVLIFPDYRFIPIIQALGRACRISTKSDVKSHFLYCYEEVDDKALNLRQEEIIMKNLSGKMVTLNYVSTTNKTYMAPNLEDKF